METTLETAPDSESITHESFIPLMGPPDLFAQTEASWLNNDARREINFQYMLRKAAEQERRRYFQTISPSSS